MTFEHTNLGRLGGLAIALAATTLATNASADSVRLVRPSQAESLYSDGLSMTVFYLGHSSPLEVVATFGDWESDKPASQLRMSLADGENIEFTIPGRPDLSFQFARSGKLIEVRSNPSDLGSAPTN